MAKGEPKKRATDPVVAGEIAATLTREDLAGAIRTLVAMAACWELRDPATTETDAKQAQRLQAIVGLLREAADDQTESAESILSKLMRDELAVAMGAAKEQVADVLITTGPDAGTITQQKLTQDRNLPPAPYNSRPLGFREVLRDRRSKSPTLPHTLWAEAAHSVTDHVAGNELATAIRRCHWAVKFILVKEEPALDPADAVEVANRIRERHKLEKQGVMEAASTALHLFRTRDRLEDGSAVNVSTKVLHTKISRYLKNERHPDGPGLESDSVDTGRFFGARDYARDPNGLRDNVAAIETAAAAVLGEALGIRGGAQEQLWQSIQRVEWPGMLDPSSRGAGFRVGAHGLVAVLQVLATDLLRRGE